MSGFSSVTDVRGSPCFGSIKQDRFYCGVKDLDFDVDDQVR